MTLRSSLASLAMVGLLLLSPLVGPARAAVERYVVNYRASNANPWLTYTTTRTPAQARAAVAELQALGYQAEYQGESVGGPVYSGGSYSYYTGPSYYYHQGGESFYDHYHFSHHSVDRHHYYHVHDHHHVYHHHHDEHHHVYHHHDVHHHQTHHHTVHHHSGHHRR